MDSILEVSNLHVAYRFPHGASCRAVTGVSFTLGARKILGVLGESGSGKSTLAAALLRLLPTNAEISAGQVLLNGKDLLQADSAELQAIRGRRFSAIFQEPSLALHPTMRVGDQIGEVLRAHEAMGANARRQRTREILHSVFTSEVERIAGSYPHQLSGGQRQRVLIAQAIACRPAVLVADEPAASLDPTTQREISSLLARLRDDLGIAIIFITHNPALLASIADRVLVLYAGKVAELGSAAEVLYAPRHPYTKALLACMPAVIDAEIRYRKSPLPAIPGSPPSLALLPQGCAFEPRCPDRMRICQLHEPASVAVSATHGASCLKLTA